MARKKTKRSKSAAAKPQPKRADKAARPTRSTTPSKPPKRDEPIAIAGIGASAGGLEAFTQLLSALPAHTGMAFVVISHLSQTHKSMLTELLAKSTEMEVSQVTETTRIQPNCVYVIPPNMNLAVSDGVIEVSPIERDPRVPMAIDFFFRSLARTRKRRAIGVLLSGTGSDGTLGLAAIKAEGGITFAQDEKSAKYPDMPCNAIRSGVADFVLAPEQIAAELARIATHPYVAASVAAPRSALPTEDDAAADTLVRIYSLIRAATGVDFTHYKSTTIKRRVSRRMLLLKIDALPVYAAYLEKNAGEIEALYRDLLINVTEFFRDLEAFQFLEDEIIPKIVAVHRSSEPIRAWIPGCATGEEAYSVAICLLEALQAYGPDPLQIFATDLSETAIKKAREGVYPENIGIDVSPERLRRFFIKIDAGYQVAKHVRDLCIFAPQNLVKDPPFSRMDLISCRNVLIYLGAALQRRVLATFHYALRPSGFLMLGSSETTSAASELFQQIDKKHRVFVKLQTAARLQLESSAGGVAREMRRSAKKSGREERAAPDMGREADRVVLSRYSPPAVVVNAAFEIVQFRGQTSRYLEPAPGVASLNLFRMARQGLAIDLRALLHHAHKHALSVRKEGLQFRVNGDVRGVNIEVIPLGPENVAERHYLVLFEDAPAAPVTVPDPATDQNADGDKGAAPLAVGRAVEALRKELAATQEDLHSIIEEQEASNEELQSANEEVLSANEELQSTNEELETAKEELQATNEELATVNEELQSRNAELSLSNNDLQNLITASDVVMVMVGHDLRIRRITPSAQRVLNLIDGDVGRPLGNIQTNLKFVDLEALISEVIDRIQPLEREVQDNQSHWYSMRIRPYRTADNKIEGAVMVLVDIDATKRGSEAEGVWRALAEPVPDFILSASPEGKVLFLNRTVASLAKRARVGQNIYDFIDPRDHEVLKRGLQKAVAEGKTTIVATLGGLTRAASASMTEVVPVKSNGRVVALTLKTNAPKKPDKAKKKR